MLSSSIDFSSVDLLYLLPLAAVLYTVYGAVYRLYLSPVAHFPGSKLAALTFWYEFYYDVVKRGAYVWKIKEMHVVYGLQKLLVRVTLSCCSYLQRR